MNIFAKHPLWITLFLVVSAAAPAARSAVVCSNEMPSDLDYERLKEWIGVCQPKTVGEVVKFLPKSYKANASFVYNSLAESESEHPGTVDPMHPRVILFGNTDFIVTYTGKPGTPSYSDLQLLEFSKKTGTIDFKVVRLSPTGAAQFDEHPKTCIKCHGDPARTIWEPYDTWPGVYGSLDDTLIEGSEELNNFEAFSNTNAFGGNGDGRYSELDKVEPLRSRLQRGTYPQQGTKFEIRPNATLGFTLQKIYARSLAKKFISSTTNPFMKDLFLWSAFNCNKRATPSSKTQFSEEITQKRATLPKRVDEVLGAQSDFNQGQVQEEIFAAVTGLRPRSLSPSLYPRWKYTTGSVDEFYEYVFWEIAREWGGEAITPGHLLDPYGKTANLTAPPIYDAFYRPRAYDPAFCSVIAARGKGLATALPEIRIETVTLPSKPVSRNPFRRCVGCHTAEGPGPEIAYGTEAGLKAQLLAEPSLRSAILQAVRSRRMPKAGLPLTEEQIQAIVDALEVPKN